MFKYNYRPHTNYGGRYCFHRYVSLTLSTGGVFFPGGGGSVRGVSHFSQREGWVPMFQKMGDPSPPQEGRQEDHPHLQYTQHGNTVTVRLVRILLECKRVTTFSIQQHIYIISSISYWNVKYRVIIKPMLVIELYNRFITQ